MFVYVATIPYDLRCCLFKAKLGINQTRANFGRIQHSQTDSAILSF